VTFTREQLEALRDGITEGRWEWVGNRGPIDTTPDEDGYFYVPECSSLGDRMIQVTDSYEGIEGDVLAIAAVPALIDQCLELMKDTA